MSREALVTNSDMSERGERVRFAEALAVFEDMHRALKARVAETPECRALEGLDAALALVADSTRANHLDLEGFSAFRGSVELLNDNTPEARALELFEGALRSMIASASDFDDLPDVYDDEDDMEDDEIAAANDSESDVVAEDAPVIVTIYETAQDAPAAEETSSPDAVIKDAALTAEAPAGTSNETPDDAEDAPEAAEAETLAEDAEPAPAEIQQRIEELEAELAAARAHQAA